MANTKSDPPPPVPKELTADDAKRLAEAVRRIDAGMKALSSSGLNRRAIVTLLHDMTEVGKRDINTVLNGLENLGDTFLEKSKEKK